MTLLLPDWLRRRAQTHADHPALEFEGDVITFAELAQRADTLDALLRSYDLRPGQVVATLLHNRPELVALAHAIPRERRVFAPLGVRLKSPEVAAMIDSCAARVLIYERATKEVVAGLPRNGSLTRICIDDEPLPGDQRCEVDGALRALDGACDIDLDATHTVVFTSGTSGSPKAVRLSWGNHYWSAIGSVLNLGLDPSDRWLCCLPLNHVGGLSILMRSVLYGNTVEVQRRFEPAALNAAIHERGASIVSVVANMLQRMLDDNGDRPYPSTLRAVLVGGGSTPEALIARCRRQEIPILLTYGLSETASQVATERPGDTASRGVGQPLAFAELRVVDPREQPTAPGTHGHIQLRGPIVSTGYLGDAERPRDEWLHTRDRGWLDERGYLHVLGRGDDTIVCGGENVHPREVERVLEAHPAVAEAFATGVADERWGKVLHAAVRIAGGADADQSSLTEHCRQQLAGYKVPRRIAIVDDFPRTPAGKIARREAAEVLLGTADERR